MRSPEMTFVFLVSTRGVSAGRLNQLADMKGSPCRDGEGRLKAREASFLSEIDGSEKAVPEANRNDTE